MKNGTELCAWCPSAFMTGGYTSTASAVLAVRAPFRQLVSRRPRYHARVHITPQCCVPSGSSSDGKSDSSDSSEDPPFHFDMEMLRRRIRETETGKNKKDEDEDVGLEVTEVTSDDADTMRFVEQFERIDSLWVIIFTSQENSEGVYSLSIGGDSIVLAFQEQREANRYARMLEKQEFPSAKVCQLEARELKEFCTVGGFRLGFVPSGALITPPEESAIDDAERWRIKDRNENAQGSADNDGSSGLSEEEIELMKRRLENLFGK